MLIYDVFFIWKYMRLIASAVGASGKFLRMLDLIPEKTVLFLTKMGCYLQKFDSSQNPDVLKRVYPFLPLICLAAK